LEYITDLRDEPEHLGLLAQWHHREWSYLNPNRTQAQRAENMKHYLGDNLIPSTYVYKNGTTVLGSAAVVESDMDTHPELGPWLAGVYVHADHRQQGVGSMLVKHIINKCMANAVTDLYLFTPGQAKFYEQLGWRTLKTEEYCGTLVTIMTLPLKSHPVAGAS